MKLWALVKFNREIKDDDITSLGPFVVSVNNKKYTFSFCTDFSGVSKSDSTIFEVLFFDNTSKFPDTDELERFVEYISSLDEFNIGTNSDILYPTELLLFSLDVVRKEVPSTHSNSVTIKTFPSEIPPNCHIVRCTLTPEALEEYNKKLFNRQ